MSGEKVKIPLEEQIGAATRAHEQRSVHYLVSREGMSTADAERENAKLEAVVATLTWLKNNPSKVRR